MGREYVESLSSLFFRVTVFAVVLLVLLQAAAAAPIIINSSVYSGYFPTQLAVGAATTAKALEVVGDVVSRSSSSSGGNATSILSDINGANIFVNPSYNLTTPNTGWVRALTINTASGNVGVGTATPYRRLDVLSTAYPQFGITNSNDAESSILFTNGHNQVFTFGLDGGGTSEGFFIYDQTAGQTRLAIDTTGKVGINTTGASYTLDVTGTARVTTSISSASFLYTSDARLKTNVTPLDNSLSLAEIMELRPVTFQWINKSIDTRTHYGLIAQDVEAVLPDAVTTGSDGYKSVEYGNLIAPLISAVQTQQKQIDAQQQQIQSLRAEIEALKAGRK